MTSPWSPPSGTPALPRSSAPPADPAWQAAPPADTSAWPAPPPADTPAWPAPPPADTPAWPPGGTPAAGSQPTPPWAYPPPPFGPPAGIATNGLRLAEASDRLVARIIDGLILLVPNLLVTAVVMGGAFWLGASVIGEPRTVADAVVWVLLLTVAYGLATLASALESYLYEVRYMHAHGGQTIGKRMRHIRVVGLEGSPATAGNLQRRWLAHSGVAVLAVIPVVGSIVGIYSWANQLWLLWDKPNRQCLHDKYAGTVVVFDEAGLLPAQVTP